MKRNHINSLMVVWKGRLTIGAIDNTCTERYGKMKRIIATLTLGLALISTSLVSSAQASNIVNGQGCTQSGALSTVKVKGISKSYVCAGNPSVVGVKGLTWTLKTCISYWAAARGQQDNINQQMSLIQAMSEPDKTTYTKKLADSQTKLNAVFAAIRKNHCAAGL